MKRLLRTIALMTAVLMLLSGCGKSRTDGTAPRTDAAADSGGGTQVPASAPDVSGLFSKRDLTDAYEADEAAAITLTGDTAVCGDSSVRVEGSTVTISGAGTYLLSGSLKDGTVIVDASKEDKIQLVLNGAEISASDFAAIYVARADKVFLTLAPGSDNVLSNGGGYTQIDSNNVDAVVFSKEDLTLNGSGSLRIFAPVGHGIVGKDDLVITGGRYEIEAASHAISGKDSLSIADGYFDLTAGKDALHSENNDDAAKGNVYLGGGSYRLTAGGDGVSASGTLTVDGGSCTVSAGFSGSDTTESQKGFKAGSGLWIRGGSITVISADDAIHSNGDLSITDGVLSLSSGDDGVHADGRVTISGGTLTVVRSYEGIEGLRITISGGTVRVTASDDGVNAGGGNDQSGFGGRGGDGFGGNSDANLTISGGEITVNADGDGLDSNGYLILCGGTVNVFGPVNDGNGALDYGVSATVTGGRLVAAGSSGMAVNFGKDSTQGAILVNVGAQAAGTAVTLTDSGGTVLLSAVPEKPYSSVNLTCPELVQGQTYRVTAGSFSAEITLDSLIYGSGGMGSGGRGGPGRR